MFYYLFMEKILILFTFIFIIGCEGQGGDVNQPSPVEKILNPTPIATSALIDNEIELAEGNYKSECIQDEEDGHNYLVQVMPYEVVVIRYNSRQGDNCNSFESYVKAVYDRNGTELDHKESNYFWRDSQYNDATFICGANWMIANQENNIDNIGCNESFEFINLNFKENDNGYEMNGVDISKF